jgi:hypothetical protein
MVSGGEVKSGVTVRLATSLWLIAGIGIAAAQDLPASGRYQCTGASGPLPELNFVVGPGEIYTTPKGWRGTMSIHPLSGNIMFRGPTPQNSYQGRYSAGPPAQVSFVTVAKGESGETGIVCRMH